MLNKEKIKEILSKRFENDLHTKLSLIPKPNAFKDMQKAALRIKEAIEQNQKVAIVGDYDVDGIISSVILSEFFDDIGLAHQVRIPNRFRDGYGLNEDIVKELDVDLIITVDNGISAHDAALLCEQKGITLIITDHHCPPPVLPKAYAIVNPKQEDCSFPADICGAQVAWYLCGAIKGVCGFNDYSLTKFMDILCIAIMSDMMELVDLNRVLVKEGLKHLNASQRPCFKVIKDFFNKELFDASSISFLLSPLLNSSGRMDDASVSFNFIKSKTIEEAKSYLDIITDLNNARKDEEKRVFEEALKQVDEFDKAVVVADSGWHKGVLGIVASRLCRHFEKPSFVFCVEDDMLQGSARSVGGIDLLELLGEIDICDIGGHSAAAGISLEYKNINTLKDILNERLKDFNVEDFCDNDKVLGEIKVSEIDLELGHMLDFFEPFGQKNPKPYFLIKNAKIINVMKIKDKNLKISFEKDGLVFQAMYFNYKLMPKQNDYVNFCVNISLNVYRGVARTQIYIDDIY